MTVSSEERKSSVAFQPVRPVHAYERIVEQIEAAILEGHLGPNEHLASERELMRAFQVGRSTVREALRVLQSKGLVQSRPGDPRGPLVLPFSSDRLRDSMYSLARVDNLSLRELLQFRIVIEASAYQLAALQRTPEQLAALEGALLDMERAIAEGEDAFTSADLAYHDIVAHASGNALLAVSISVVRDIVGSLVRSKIVAAIDREAQMRESCRRHHVVLAAVRDSDGERAAALARRNLFEYYAPHLPVDERDVVAALVDWDAVDSSAAASDVHEA